MAVLSPTISPSGFSADFGKTAKGTFFHTSLANLISPLVRGFTSTVRTGTWRYRSTALALVQNGQMAYE